MTLWKNKAVGLSLIALSLLIKDLGVIMFFGVIGLGLIFEEQENYIL